MENPRLTVGLGSFFDPERSETAPTRRLENNYRINVATDYQGAVRELAPSTIP